MRILKVLIIFLVFCVFLSSCYTYSRSQMTNKAHSLEMEGEVDRAAYWYLMAEKERDKILIKFDE